MSAKKAKVAVPTCPFCCASTEFLPLADTQYKFNRCVRCGYWTARAGDDSWPTFDYNDAPDYVTEVRDWNIIIRDVKRVMKHKFAVARVAKKRFLDIGCSEGAYVAAARDLGWGAAGIEVDEAKLARCLDRGLDCRKVNLLSSPPTTIPTADFVLLRHVIEHIPDFIRFTRAAGAAVADGGVLWVEVPNQAAERLCGHTRKVREGRYLGSLYPPTHLHAFEPRALRHLAGAIGLSCERIVTYANSNDNWLPRYLCRISGGKKMLHWLLERTGYGFNIAAIYRKTARAQPQSGNGLLRHHPYI